MIDGYKTYLVAAATAVYGIAGLIIGQLDINQTVQFVLTALGLAGLRSGISKL